MGGQSGHLGLGDAVDAHGLHQVVDPPGGHTLHVGLAHHGHERLLGPAPGLEQELGRVHALAQLGHGQFDGAHPRVPGPCPVAVAGVLPLVGPLAVAGVALHRGLGTHEGLSEGSEHGPGQVGVAVGTLEVLA